MAHAISWFLDSQAEVKAVYYEGTSTIYEGMPVCYNFDSTDNWTGYGAATLAAAKTEQGTTAEGEQNEGKYIRVENPSVSNYLWLAGYVAGTKKAGTAGPCVLDIYVPNGAIVPIRTDKSVVIHDKLYLEAGELTLVNATQVGLGPWVAIAEETVDRSSTAGVCLARIFLPKNDLIYIGTLGVAPSELLWKDCPWEDIERNPGLGIVYFNDFVNAENLVTAEGWTITAVTTGTLSLVASEGGELKADSAGSTTSDDGVEAQLLNCRFLPAAGKTIWFEARVKMNDATDLYFVGLAATDTTLIAAGVVDDVSDKCGFFHHAASTNDKISSITARTSADDATADVATNTDATYMTVGFRISGLTSVEFYVNGALVETGTTAANIPNAAMCLSLVSKIEVAGADAELSVDWVKIAQLGARA
mgnify:CR=1 FL=1